MPGGGIFLFDMETSERMAEWNSHVDDGNCLAVTADNRLLVSGSDEKTANVWDMTSDFKSVAVFDTADWVCNVDITQIVGSALLEMSMGS